jgi:hypothetical protein
MTGSGEKDKLVCSCWAHCPLLSFPDSTPTDNTPIAPSTHDTHLTLFLSSVLSSHAYISNRRSLRAPASPK